MINFLHTFEPHSVLIAFGPIKIYWYGIFIVTGLLVAMLVIFTLADYYQIKKDILIDLAFWLILGGIAGARVYHIFLELPYYLSNPGEMIKIWHGGLAIHGAIIAGLIIIWGMARKHALDFWLISAIIVPGLALAQAIGRWGNYFNQELYGKQTDLPWGIPISFINRLPGYTFFTYFHPTFLYECFGNLLIFLVLIYLHRLLIKKNCFESVCYRLVVIAYLVMYSLLRFSLEFVRIDPTPEVLGLRLPQIVSLLLIFACLGYAWYLKVKGKLGPLKTLAKR